MSTEAPQKRKHYQLHRWVGIISGFLGVLVFGSGAVATFHHELDAWAHRGEPMPAVLSLGGFSLDKAFATAGANVDPKFKHAVNIFQRGPHPLGFFFHEHEEGSGGQVTEVGVYTEVHPKTGEVVYRKEGTAEEVFKPKPLAALSDFFLQLHILLLMPRTMGLVATGLIGFSLLVLVATGYLVHRPSPARTHGFPSDEGRRPFYGKLHTWVGSWTLPYTVVLAMTGTFFSFAGAVLIPVMALVAFDGDMETLIRTVVGKVEVSKSEEVASLDPILADARERYPHADFETLALDEWGKEDANATVFLVEHGALGESRVQLVYDGHSGDFIMEKPQLGTEPSVGNSLLLLMGYLHFGTLLGIVTKVLWGLLGLATCAIAASGLVIFGLRQEKLGTRWVGAVRIGIVALVGGLPAAFAGTALAWAIGVGVGVNPAAAMPWVFALLTAAVAASTARLPSLRTAIASGWGAAALFLLFLPFANLAATGSSPGALWSQPDLRATLAVDVVLIISAALAMAATLRLLGGARSEKDSIEGQSAASAPVAL
ncbi:MAG: PepSY-associated TM helix domain-containing protein [Myxococcota bacterium]